MGLGGEGYFYTPDLKINVSNERVHFQTFTRLEGEGCLCAPDLKFNVSKLRVIFRLLRVRQGRAIFPKWRSCLFFEEALKTWKSRVRVNGLIFRVLRVWEGRDIFMPRILKSTFLSKACICKLLRVWKSISPKKRRSCVFFEEALRSRKSHFRIKGFVVGPSNLT